MATAAKAAPGREEMSVVADKGYFGSREILACHKADIIPTAPRPETSVNRKKGMYVKADFAYDAARDVYRCPYEADLIYRYTREEGGLKVRRYWDKRMHPMPPQTTLHYRQGATDHPMGA